MKANEKRHQSTSSASRTFCAKREGPSVPIPLVPSDGLYLWDRGFLIDKVLHSSPRRSVQKFVTAFEVVWKRIPDQDRTTLLDFWRAQPEKAHAPIIELNPTRMSPSLLAACQGGHQLKFAGHFVETAPPTSIAHAIAHELGHAISYPHDWYEQHECAAGTGRECVACECRALSYMAAWGFDPFHDLLPNAYAEFLRSRFRTRR